MYGRKRLKIWSTTSGALSSWCGFRSVWSDFVRNDSMLVTKARRRRRRSSAPRGKSEVPVAMRLAMNAVSRARSAALSATFGLGVLMCDNLSQREAIASKSKWWRRANDRSP